MFPIEAVAGGLSLLGGLGGGGGSGYRDARRNADSNAGTLADVRNWYDTNRNTQQGYYNLDNGTARQGTSRLLDYLGRDPVTDDRYARDLSRAKGSLDRNMATAGNNLTAQYSANGQMSPGGAPSSSSQGIQAYLAAANALGTNEAMTQVAGNNYETRKRNLFDYANVASGQAATDWGNANSSAGNEAGLTQSLMDYYAKQAQEQAARDQQGFGATISTLGSVAGDIGGMFAGKGTSTFNPNHYDGDGHPVAGPPTLAESRNGAASRVSGAGTSSLRNYAARPGY